MCCLECIRFNCCIILHIYNNLSTHFLPKDMRAISRFFFNYEQHCYGCYFMCFLCKRVSGDIFLEGNFWIIGHMSVQLYERVLYHLGWAQLCRNNKRPPTTQCITTKQRCISRCHYSPTAGCLWSVPYYFTWDLGGGGSWYLEHWSSGGKGLDTHCSYAVG